MNLNGASLSLVVPSWGFLSSHFVKIARTGQCPLSFILEPIKPLIPYRYHIGGSIIPQQSTSPIIHGQQRQIKRWLYHVQRRRVRSYSVDYTSCCVNIRSNQISTNSTRISFTYFISIRFVNSPTMLDLLASTSLASAQAAMELFWSECGSSDIKIMTVAEVTVFASYLCSEVNFFFAVTGSG